MSGISFRTTGSFSNMERFLNSMQQMDLRRILQPYGEQGVQALAAATPVRTGLTAQSWTYEINVDRRGATITWLNTDVENGFQVALMLQYGHGTGTGGYVQGLDYINPAIKPIFDQIADAVWKEVTSA